MVFLFLFFLIKKIPSAKLTLCHVAETV